MRKQCKRALSLAISFVLLLQLLPVLGIAAADPQITTDQLEYGITGETAIDMTGTSASFVKGYVAGQSTLPYDDYATASYENGIFTHTPKGNKGWDVKLLMIVSFPTALEEYSYVIDALTDNTRIPIFVGSDNKAYFLHLGGGDSFVYTYISTDVADMDSQKTTMWPDCQAGDAYKQICSGESAKVTIRYIYEGSAISAVQLTLANSDGEVYYDHPVALNLWEPLPTVDATKIAVHYEKLYDNQSFTDPLQLTVQGENKTPVATWINAHPVLIDMKNGVDVKTYHNADGIARAKAALADFAALKAEDPALAEAVEKNGYYTDEIAELLTVIQNTPEGGIFSSDITTDYMVEGQLDLTGTTAEIYHPSEINSWNYYWTYTDGQGTPTAPVYQDGVFSVAYHSNFSTSYNWECEHTLDITLNQPVTSYTVEGVFQQGSRIPLFKGSDGNYYSLQSMAVQSKPELNNYYQFGTMNSFTSGDSNGSGDSASDDKLSAAFSEDTVKIKVSYTYTGTDATGLTLEIIHKETGAVKWSKAITFPEGVTAVTDHVLMAVKDIASGTKSYTFQIWGTHADNHKIVDFVNDHVILNAVKKDPSFSADSYIADAVYTEITAAKAAYEALTDKALQQALVDNGFYDASKINSIIYEKVAAPLRDSFQGIAPYLVEGFAVKAANAAAVKANITAAKATYLALNDAQKEAAVGGGLYDEEKLNSLYYSALPYVDGVLRVTDFSGDAAVLVSGSSYSIPQYSGLGFAKATLTASFTFSSNTETLEIIGVDAYDNHLQLSDFAVENGVVFATVGMRQGNGSYVTYEKFPIATTEETVLPETITTDPLSFTYEAPKHWLGEGMHEPRWTVENSQRNGSCQLKDDTTTAIDIKAIGAFSVGTGAAVTGLDVVYYDTAKLAVPSVTGATIRTKEANDQGLRFQTLLTGSVDSEAYAVVEYGTLYATTHTVPSGSMLSVDYAGAKTASDTTGILPEDEYFLNIDGSDQNGFQFTDFTVRSYVKYRDQVSGNEFILYSQECTRRVVGIARAIYEAYFASYAFESGSSLETERDAINTILAGPGATSQAEATERLDQLLAFMIENKDLITEQNAVQQP